VDRFCDIDYVAPCIINSSGEFVQEVLNMFPNYRTVGPDVRGSQGSTDNFPATITMFCMGTSREDVRCTASWVAGEGIKITFFEAVIEAVDRLEGLWSREG